MLEKVQAVVFAVSTMGYILKMPWLSASFILLWLLINAFQYFYFPFPHKGVQLLLWGLNILSLLAILSFIVSSFVRLNYWYLAIGLWLLLALGHFVFSIVYKQS